jgi:hypothetical protein
MPVLTLYVALPIVIKYSPQRGDGHSQIPHQYLLSKMDIFYLSSIVDDAQLRSNELE